MKHEKHENEKSLKIKLENIVILLFWGREDSISIYMFEREEVIILFGYFCQIKISDRSTESTI